MAARTEALLIMDTSISEHSEADTVYDSESVQTRSSLTVGRIVSFKLTCHFGRDN